MTVCEDCKHYLTRAEKLGQPESKTVAHRCLQRERAHVEMEEADVVCASYAPNSKCSTLAKLETW